MQTRLFACIAGGLVGVVDTSPINGGLGLRPTGALIGCSPLGGALGYVARAYFSMYSLRAPAHRGDHRQPRSQPEGEKYVQALKLRLMRNKDVLLGVVEGRARGDEADADLRRTTRCSSSPRSLNRPYLAETENRA